MTLVSRVREWLNQVADDIKAITPNYAVSGAVQSRNSATMSNLGVALPLAAGGVYEATLRVSFTSANILQAIKVGFAPLPAGCAIQGLGWIQNSATAAVMSPVTNPADPTCQGSASILSATLVAEIRARVMVGTTAGQLVGQAAGIGVAGTLSIPAGGATLELRRIR